MSGSWEWECSSCTFLNDHIDHQSACQMCLIERRRPWNDSSSSALNDAIEKRNQSHRHDVVIEATSNRRSLSGSSDSRRLGVGTEIFKSNDEASIKQGENHSQASVNRGRWDAFASLQANYESSSDEEADDRSCDGTNSNEGSSEFSDGDSVDEGEIDGECDRKSDYHHGLDGPCHNDKGFNDKITTQKKTNKLVECINLVDSDDEDNVLDTFEKENETNALEKSRPKQRPTKSHTEHDSDCSLSEEESHRPIPSPSMRGIPSWQPPRRRSSTPIETSNHGSIKSSDHFPCLSTRNDVIGNSSSPCMVSNHAPRSSKTSREMGRRRSSKKSSPLTETSSDASKSRKKTRSSSTSKAASSKGGANAPARRRRRGGGGKFKRRSSYKRSSAKGAGTSRGADASNNNTNGNSAWSERERGIRQPHRRGGGGPYMAIAKQEPMLRNVGGASIQF